MPFEDPEEQTHTIEAEEATTKADEFFQKQGLSERERELALLSLKTIGKDFRVSGSLDSHVGAEHMEGIPRERLKAVSQAVQEWIHLER
ncbi:MAG: hypothetical protein PHS53_05205 [Candidatus Pacebacteria bacterium]|nr:hypothetical protein [Candidatus Paceibacterota bacterium]MDD5357507.1 hypothetical protein [Candidatus Paceibacterota bacterium]